MSWNDRLANSPFSITTGDGKTYTPLWKGGETEKEYQATIFEFIDKPGAFVDRRNVKARSFPLVFWFQGDDNIEQATAFDLSANDQRAWLVSHPFYGEINGQPLGIKRNDQNYNITEINVDFWETITENLPDKTVSRPDQQLDDARQLAVFSAADYANKVDLQPTDIAAMADTTRKMDLSISALLTSDTYSSYQDIKNKTFTAITRAANEPTEAIQNLYQLIGEPAGFKSELITRLSVYAQLWEQAKGILGVKTNNANKSYVEAAGAAIVAGAVLAAANPLPGDYLTRRNVAIASAALNALYTGYQQTMNSLYSNQNGQPGSFAAGHSTQSAISALVLNGIEGLGIIAFGAKQERTVLLDKDSNLIVLAHRYAGLDQDDVNIEQFRQLNDIKNKSLFNLKKGREVKYLV